MWGVTQSYARHDAFIGETWRIHIWGMTHSYARNDIFIGEAWFIHTWGMTHSYVMHDALICEAWHIHQWGMTHMRYDASMHMCITRQCVCLCACACACACVRARACACVCVCTCTSQDTLHVQVHFNMWDMTHTCVWHKCDKTWPSASTYFFQVSDMTHLYVRHDAFTCASWLIHMCNTLNTPKLYGINILKSISSIDSHCKLIWLVGIQNCWNIQMRSFKTFPRRPFILGAPCERLRELCSLMCLFFSVFLFYTVLVWMHAHISVFLRIYTHTSLQTYMHTNKQTCKHTCIQTCIHT